MEEESPDLDVFDPAYLNTLDEIYHSGWVAPRRYRMDLLAEAMEHFWPEGHPSRFVHLAGTNGKGSVAFYLEQGFRLTGAATGSWTGPHLFDYAERIHLNGAQAERAEIVHVYRDILEPYHRTFTRQRQGAALSFAELGILLSLHLFERHGVRWALMETGAGGRYSPLMALKAAACAVTDVGHDHPRSLGSELWQRALTKGGIGRPGVPLFTAAEGPARGYVVKTAEACGAEVRAVQNADLEAVDVVDADNAPRPRFANRNLALAGLVIRHFHPELTWGDLVPAMAARLPGRFWRPEPQVVVDVAHNEEKVRAFAEQLRLAFPGRKFRFLLGLTRSRDALRVFQPLLELAESVCVTSASYAGQPPEAVAARLRETFPAVRVEPEPQEAYRQEREALGPDDLLVVTGSAYAIDQALNPDPYVRHLNATFGWRWQRGDVQAGGLGPTTAEANFEGPPKGGCASRSRRETRMRGDGPGE